MWCVWTAKGGSGASVVSAALAVLSSRSTPTLLVDLGSDQPALLGLGAGGASDGPPTDEPAAGLGVLDWLAAPCPPPDALARIEVRVGPTLSLLPTGRLIGTGHPDGPGLAGDGRRAERLDVLARLLGREERTVVVDVGSASHRYEPILARSSASVLVTRACYLALRRPVSSRHVDRVVLIAEPGRALRRADVDAALPAPVSATVSWDPAIARAVDAGTLLRRVPRPLGALRTLLRQLPASPNDPAIGSTR
jgi:hypothetical protein